MPTFTGEEKLDLLLKKVSYGVSKTGTSQATGPDGEPLTSFTAVRPEHVFKQATTGNVPTTPPGTSTAIVGVYKKDGTGSAGTTGQIQAPVAASGIAASAQMPGFTNFKRAWDTGINNWLGPAFGGDYAVKVYVGDSGWNGLASSMASSSIVEVIFGSDPAADWFFDYEAGVLYWTNEEGADTGSTTFDQSTNFVNSGTTSSAGTTITNGDVVYIAGYAYKGTVGIGGDSLSLGSDFDAFAGIDGTTLEFDDQSGNKFLGSPANGSNGAVSFRALVSDDIPDNAADTSGSAGSLSTGRTFQVDLTSTSVSTAFDGSGNIHDVGVTGTLPVANGGTGLTSLSTLLNANVTASSLGLVIGANVQAFDAQLSDIAGLTPDDSHFIVGDGSNFITESGSTARTSLGLGSIATQAANSVDIDGGAIDGTTIGANTAAAGSFTTIDASSNVTISGNLSVAGTVSQTNSTEVNFNDTRLRLNVPTSLLDDSIENTAAPTTNTNVGLEIFNGANSGALLNGPLWVYNYDTDHWGASIQGSETTLDNVKAFKFNVTTTDLGDEAAATNDIADLYGTADTARSNDKNIRSVGAVSKCTIDITTDANDDGSNFAPVAAAANGYPIQHDLDTSSVFVFALKTHKAGSDGTGGAATAIDEPQPIFCKFKVITANIVEVSVGITIENEKYDIIVIG